MIIGNGISGLLSRPFHEFVKTKSIYCNKLLLYSMKFPCVLHSVNNFRKELQNLISKSTGGDVSASPSVSERLAIRRGRRDELREFYYLMAEKKGVAKRKESKNAAVVRNNRKGAPTHTNLVQPVNVWYTYTERHPHGGWGRVQGHRRPRIQFSAWFVRPSLPAETRGAHFAQFDLHRTSRQVDSFVSLFTTSSQREPGLVPVRKIARFSSTVPYEHSTTWYCVYPKKCKKSVSWVCFDLARRGSFGY